jgi:hypothetical protein
VNEMKKQEMIEALKIKGIQAVDGNEWDEETDGIWIKGWTGFEVDPFNYSANVWDSREEIYELGVEKGLRGWLKSQGWFAEPYDAGTWFLVED